MPLLNTKFSTSKQNFPLAEFGRRRQYPGEALDLYVRRFMKKHWIVVIMDEEVLMNVCLHGMMDKCRVFLENVSLSSFSKLMKATRQTNESVRTTSRASSVNHSNPIINPPPRKRPIVSALEKDQEARFSSLNKRSYKQE